jgi:hypothetical protein
MGDEGCCRKLDKLGGQLKKLPLLILLPPCAIPKIPVLVFKAVSGLVLKLGCIEQLRGWPR